MRIPFTKYAVEQRRTTPDKKLAKPGDVGVEEEDPGSAYWGESDREVNPDMLGGVRYLNLDRMVMTDPVVAGMLAGIELPISGTAWDVVPASDDPWDKMVAEACEVQLGLGDHDDAWLAGGWDALLANALLHLQYGSITLAFRWRDKPLSWTTEDGFTRDILPIDKISPRFPHRLSEYVGGDDPGTPLKSVRQDGVKGLLDGNRLIHLVLNPQLSRFTGMSVLRPAYGSYKLKRKMLVSAAVGYDRFAAGTPVVRSPGTGNAEEERLARAMGRGYKNHEKSYFWLTGKKPGPNEAGWDIEILNGSGTLADPIPQLRHYDEQMVSAALSRFFMLGSTDTGSRAVGEVLSEPFYMALNWHAHRIGKELTAQLLAKFVKVNFGADTSVPRIVPGTIQQKNLAARGAFIQQAESAGVTFADRGAQNTIRGWVDIEDLPEDWPLEGTPPAGEDAPAPPAADGEDATGDAAPILG